MRQARIKTTEEACYHITSRCALQSFLFDREAKDMFVKMMRRAETFSGVHIITYCVMDNHFHLLVKVPKTREVGENELKDRIATLYGSPKAERIFARWDALRENGEYEMVEDEKKAFKKRMYDISEFVKTLKQRYSLWFCSNHARTGDENFGNKLEGTIWQGRFHSVLVEQSQRALTAVAAYIDMNPVRAGMVANAKAYRWSGYGAARRGDSKAKKAHIEIETEFYDDIIAQRQGALANRTVSLSRGVAVGTVKFVSMTISLANARKRGFTVPHPLAKSGKLALICTAIRKTSEC